MPVKRNIITLDTFRGCDFTNSATDMEMDKSPNCENMIRDVPGKIRKRMGYKLDSKYNAQINGYHYLANENLACIHAGKKIYNVGGSAKSAYFEDYEYEPSDSKKPYAEVVIQEREDIEKPKAPNCFVTVGTSGYAKGKYDKLVGGNMMTNLRSVCYGAGRYIAVGDAGRAYYSTDKGKSWIKMSGLDTAKVYYSVCYDEAQSMFIAVGQNVIYCCRDGIHWYNASPKKTLNYTFYGVAGTYAANNYHQNGVLAIAVSVNAYAIIKKGKGGAEGDDIEIITTGLTPNVTYRAVIGLKPLSEDGVYPKFLLVGDSAYAALIEFSEAERNISLYRFTKNAHYYALGYVGKYLYAVGTGGAMVRATNLNNPKENSWTVRDVPNKETYNLSGIAYNGEYAVICTSNSNYSYYSKDLETWTRLKIKYNYMQGVCAPIAEKEETYFNATFYFDDYSSADLLPATVIKKSEDKTYQLHYELSDYKKKVTSVVFDYYLCEPAKLFKYTEDEITSIDALYSNAEDDRSVSVPFNGKMYILDGKAMLQYDGYTVKNVSNIAYIPTLTISKDPGGGGTDYEALNLLQPGFTELFLGVASKTTYQMTFGELDETKVKAWVKNSNGEWVEKYEGTDFSVDRITGIITFNSAPGAPPVTGEDNVKITAYRTVDGYADRINKCKIACLFGVGGAQDRVFVTGNPDKEYLNYDWYSERNNATYFGDTSYCTLGNASSSVVGYALINNYLAAFKGEGELHQNVLIRSGNLEESKAAFPLVNTLQGEGAIAPRSFQYLATEPVFLTRSGIMAITVQDISAEKYTQSRSFFLNGRLLKEDIEDLKNACSVMYNDMYLLALNNKVYVLDGIQPIQTDKSAPYATRQYAGFYCTNIPARVMWKDEDGKLCFGTDQGQVYKFYDDVDDIYSYNDAGEPINAFYESPDLDGKVFFKNKTFKFIAVRVGIALATSVSIYTWARGIWTFLKKNTAEYISFEKIKFSRMAFTCDTTEKLISGKARVKKVDKARIKLANAELNEPFSIYDVGLEYTENGNHK